MKWFTKLDQQTNFNLIRMKEKKNKKLFFKHIIGFLSI